jgi:RHS repeat-associated protein
VSTPNSPERLRTRTLENSRLITSRWNLHRSTNHRFGHKTSTMILLWRGGPGNHLEGAPPKLLLLGWVFSPELSLSGTYTTQIVYAPDGYKFAKMNGQTMSKYFAPLAAGMAAVRARDGTGYFQHADWLGSNRLTVAAANRFVLYDAAYAPFGETYNSFGSDPSFTGQNQDTANGIYDFLFRQQSPVQGRWISPDPAGLAAANPAAPQTWNRYAYVANNPLSFVDLLGLEPIVYCAALIPDRDDWPVQEGVDCIPLSTGVNSPEFPPIGPHPPPDREPPFPPAANNGTPKQTKQQCIDNFLKTGYGPAGNFMAKTGVPSFSAISIFTNTWSWLKGEGATLLAKGALSAGPMAYGKILTTTGTNMAAYPGTAAAGADIAETGAFWTTTGATAGEVLLFVGVEGSVFATTADAYARWTCRNVP